MSSGIESSESSFSRTDVTSWDSRPGIQSCRSGGPIHTIQLRTTTLEDLPAGNRHVLSPSSGKPMNIRTLDFLLHSLAAVRKPWIRGKSSVWVLAVTLAVSVKVCAKAKSNGETLTTSHKMEPARSGAIHYEKLCSGCHGSDGSALAGEAPPLVGSTWVSGPETRLIRIVTHGVRGPIQVAGKTYDREMPGVGHKLSDREIASLVTFVRSRWGVGSVPTTTESVRRIRVAAKNRNRYWSVEELLSTP